MNIFMWALVLGLIPAVIAHGKGRNFFAWWLYGAALFIVALPHAIVMGQRESSNRMKCPHCAEFIQREALVCRYCGRNVEDPTHQGAIDFEQQSTHQPTSVVLKANPDPAPTPATDAANRELNNQGAKRLLIAIGAISIAGALWAAASSVKHLESVKADQAPVTTQTVQAASSALPHKPELPFVYADFGAAIRSKPSAKAEVLRYTSLGEKLEYVGQIPGWYRLATADTSDQRWLNKKAVLSAEEYSRRSGAELRLDAWNWGTEYGIAKAEGQVTNVSGRTLENVEVLVTFTTSSGEFISSDHSFLQYTTLLPGQSSPWKVMANENPAMSKASVEFKTLDGERIFSYSRR